MTKDDPNLDKAYSLETPEDSVNLYRAWASTYDEGFAQEMDYIYPAIVAGVFREYAQASNGLILDVGAGTGLVGEGLAHLGDWQVDGLDISTEMLEVALSKGCYHAAITADLTQKLPLQSNTYDGVISAGTFTHGHVGPEALDELLRVARPGALFSLGVNAAVYAAKGFDRKFDELSAGIRDFQILEKPIYGENAQADHKSDLACVVVFRKA